VVTASEFATIRHRHLQSYGARYGRIGKLHRDRLLLRRFNGGDRRGYKHNDGSMGPVIGISLGSSFGRIAVFHDSHVLTIPDADFGISFPRTPLLLFVVDSFVG
jgi:hypothetical protein